MDSNSSRVKSNTKINIMIVGFSLLIFLLSGCRERNVSGSNHPIEFTKPVKVKVEGYNGNIMEPFISRNGSFLLFNNLNAAPENTNLHWATRLNDTVFEYKGEIAGVNTADLEGVPSLDNAGNLYFVSTRDYSNTLSTLYHGNFTEGNASNIQIVNGVSKLQAPWLNFDVEVSADGATLYFVDGRFGQTGIPETADLVIAKKTGSGFERMSNSNSILKNINTDALEYAACISENELEFYFTRLKLPITPNSTPEIFISTRVHRDEAFGAPIKIASIEGFVEAATVAPDQKTIYFHMKEGSKFGLYMIRKK